MEIGGHTTPLNYVIASIRIVFAIMIPVIYLCVSNGLRRLENKTLPRGNA